MANNNFYGVRIAEGTAYTSVEGIQSGIVMAIGTAPIHQTDGKPNQIIVANTWDEAVSNLGWSDDWEKYTLCEVMYSQFKLYGFGPIIFVNVLNPEDHLTDVEAQEMAISSGKIELTGDAVADSIVVDGYTAGEDYDIFYEDGKCCIEALYGGAMESATTATVSYSMVDFDIADLTEDVIGGADAKTGERTGIELVDAAFYKERVLPEILIAPGFSQEPTIAAALTSKAQSFSTVFRALAVCDLDSETYQNYMDVVDAKEKEDAFQMERQVLCWPMVRYKDKIFHASTHFAGRSNQTDEENDGVPSDTASNKAIPADAACLADGTEILMDLTQANYLRGNGIVTVLNFVEGFTLWGCYNSCYPVTQETKDIFTNVNRMFIYVCNQIVLRCWSKIDQRLTSRLPSAIVDEINMWLNTLVGDGHLLGARAELKAEENTVENLMAGILHIHVYMTPPTPLQEIDFTVEYDVSYLENYDYFE